MAKKVAIGIQDFEKIKDRDVFYIDKTHFIKEWWESGDDITLITRPRRFGKTLNMSTLDYFFSLKHAGRGDLFEGLSIWEEEKYRKLQGTYPVIFLTFADVKFSKYELTRKRMNSNIANACREYQKVLENEMFSEEDRAFFKSVNTDMNDETAAGALRELCRCLEKYYGKKSIILIDEYDTPMLEAYTGGYWNEMVEYMRTLFNSLFKTNPYIEKGLMTGITRVSKESMFSDLNNLTVVTTTSEEYTTAFGFTEKEVFAAIDSQGLPESDKEQVKKWYDGFTFGNTPDIYNPWSIIIYLRRHTFGAHWANTSSNSLAGELIRSGEVRIKTDFETLLQGGSIEATIDEQIVFSDLGKKEGSIWSLLMASGYLKIDEVIDGYPGEIIKCRMSLTNYEVKKMFERMVTDWFAEGSYFGSFVSSMLKGEAREMNHYMNKIALNTFSYFDTGKEPSEKKEPERFYHGFVLGLMAENAKGYILKSNRESGLGRYDVVMEPKDPTQVAVIIEFKVYDKIDGEKSLDDTAANALVQIEEKHYDTDLLQRGIPAENILKYGFAFEGEKCLIKKG